jgi:hypothetical protein
MRLAISGVLLLALAATAGCVDIESPQDRALAYGMFGAAVGASVGAAVAINPGLGAAIGAGAGGAIGAAAGVISAEPEPSYAPIDPSVANLPLGFYDTYPPGAQGPPLGSEVPRPPLRGG